MDAVDIMVEVLQAMQRGGVKAKDLEQFKQEVLHKTRPEVIEIARHWVTVRGSTYV